MDLSVIIPIHNTEKYLKRCVDSIILNSRYDIEIILVDNASESEINLDFISNYDNVKYIGLKENIGPGGARNLWTSAATGKYIAFCDSDDWVDASFYDKLIEALENNSAEMAIGGIIRNFDYKSTDLPIKCNFTDYKCINSDLLFRLISEEYDVNMRIPPSSVNRVYSAKFLEENALIFIEKVFYEDLPFSLKATLCVKKCVCVPGVFYHHFKRTGSITQSFTQKHLDDFKVVFDDIRNYLVKRDLFEPYKKNYYLFLEHFYNLVVRQIFEYEKDENNRKSFLKSSLKTFESLVDRDEYLDLLSSEQLRKHIQPDICSTVIN